MRKISLDKFWRVGLVLSITLLLITGAFAFQRLFSLSDTNEQISHTYEVIDEINLLASALKDAETGQRGFLLTANEDYLSPYHSAIAEIPKIENRLQTLVSDNELQRTRLAQIKKLIDTRLQIIDQTINFMRSGRREEAIKTESSGEGKRLMDEIRRITNEMQQEEEILLQSRAERARDFRITSYLIVAAVVLISLILTLVAFFTNKEIERRSKRLREEAKEREIAETALQESEARFRLALQHAPIAVYQTDKERRYTWIHNANARINIPDIIGKRDEEFFPYEDVADMIEVKERVLATGVGERKIIRFKYMDSVESYDMIAEPSRDANGEIDGLTVAAINVTQLKNAEDALLESEAQFKAIANTVPQIVWSTRADGYHDYFNERWYEYTGMPRIDDQGWNWKDYLHEDDFERSQVVWNHSLETGEPYEIEYRFRRIDGVYRWFIGRALPIKDEAGNITRWFGTCTDVDDQKRMMQEREELLDSERAARTEVERAIRLKDEFVATLSHELRSPMNVILGWSRILKSGLFDTAALNKGLDTIERNTKIQAQLISDLLDMNRLISGKLRLNITPVDLGDIIENAVRSNIQTAETKGIKIQTLIDTSVSNIMGDPARLEQVLWNLLSNALKFTPKDGHIKIITQKTNSSIEIIVSDDGEGIDPSFVPYIFDRYRQADGSSSRTHGGLGIGLSIVKNLVELHGGTIMVTSEGKGKGATFTIKLPIAPVIKSTPHTNHSSRHAHDIIPEQTLSGVNVLVVDDEMDSRELVKRILEDCEAQVTVAVSANDALLLYQHKKPDIILSDIGMPGKDGYHFIRELRCLEGGRRTPAVALTAFARLEDRTRALVEGYNAHIAKPVDATELIATLASLINLSED